MQSICKQVVDVHHEEGKLLPLCRSKLHEHEPLMRNEVVNMQIDSLVDRQKTKVGEE